MTFIDTLDIGCAACGATYTAGETHDCPGYNLWGQRDGTAVGLNEEVVLYIRPEPEPRPREVLGVEIGSWREAREIVGGIVVVLALWYGTPWVLDIAAAAL